MDIYRLREICTTASFDYAFLMDMLKDYKAPHQKIRRFIQSGEIIRVKKGLYILGPAHQREPIDLCHLANLISGPSYVSQWFALSHYGLIPERTTVVTCMTTQRKRHFQTPVGHFAYDHIHPAQFSIGVTRQLSSQSYWIATPEKALCDILRFQSPVLPADALWTHLIDSLRMDASDLLELDINLLENIVSRTRKLQLRALLECLTAKRRTP